jgi:transcriptional regulator with XRE-family HTH domain
MVHDNVRRIREAKGVTKTHVASKLDLSLQGYTHIESGSVRLDVERLKVISKILGVNVEVFFDNEITDSVIREIQANKSA